MSHFHKKHHTIEIALSQRVAAIQCMPSLFIKTLQSTTKNISTTPDTELSTPPLPPAPTFRPAQAVCYTKI